MFSNMTSSSTWHEIMRQPDIWQQWVGELTPRAREIRAWIKRKKIREIWLCGAGTSAFIGEIVAVGATLPDIILRPVATTDFMSCPDIYINNRADILVVQFGRSGDSSESVAMLEVLDAAMPAAHRLHITCNANGALATRQVSGSGDLRCIILPERSCDAGFAMTSSFSTMLLTALACLLPVFDVDRHLSELAGQAGIILNQLTTSAMRSRPQRVVFLGSGPLKALAREAALKVLELTAGVVMTQWDSPLGFRHGPKAAINGNTSIVLFMHPAAYPSQYERDLTDELRRQFKDSDIITIGPEASDIIVPAYPDPRMSAVLYILAAQIWAIQWSASLGLNIDNPFANGNLSRVIKDVRMYPWVA